MGEVDSDSDVEFQDSREILPTRSLADSIAVPRVPLTTTQETILLYNCYGFWGLTRC